MLQNRKKHDFKRHFLVNYTKEDTQKFLFGNLNQSKTRSGYEKPCCDLRRPGKERCLHCEIYLTILTYLPVLKLPINLSGRS